MENTVFLKKAKQKTANWKKAGFFVRSLCYAKVI
jgi:hypothetical protein